MTLLSQQLQKLSLPQDQVKGGAIQHSSLIFSTRVASDYDIQVSRLLRKVIITCFDWKS